MTAPRYTSALLEAREQLAVTLAVLVVERRDQELDRAADLGAELVGDLLLLARALGEQRRQPLLDRQREEPPGAEQRDERAQRDRLLEPQLAAPRAHAGALALARPHERPARAVGDERERHAGCARKLGRAVERAGRPPLAGERPSTAPCPCS